MVDLTDAPSPADDPRGYLNSLSAHQGRHGDTTLLHPDFASRLAGAVRDARAMGLDVGLESGYRTNDTTGSKYDASGMSLHGYGAAADVSGIGGPGSSTAQLWASIAEAHGLHNPYWNVDAKPGTVEARTMAKEYNHWQLIPDKLENRKDITDAIGQAEGDQSKIWSAIAPVENVSANQSLLDKTSSNVPKSLADLTPTANLPHDSVANLLKAYQSGAMPPDVRTAFEKDVGDGKVMLPTNMSLGGEATKPSDGAFEVPKTLVDNYNAAAKDPYATGAMPTEARQAVDRDLASGRIKLPSGAVLNQYYPSMVDNLVEGVTGAKRSTLATKNLPEIGLEHGNQPPLLAGLSDPGGKGRALVAAALAAGAKGSELLQILKAQFPDLNYAQDEKGNTIVANNKTGAEYVLDRPGFTTRDMAQALGTAAAFTPASRAGTVLGAAGANALTQTAIEGVHAAAGGNFSPENIAIAGGLGAGIPLVAKAASAVASPAKALIGAVTGRAVPEAAGAEAAAQPAAAEMAGAPPLPPTGGAGPASVDATLAAAPHPAPAPEAAAAAPRNAAEATLAPEAISQPITPLSDKELVATAKTAGSGVIGSSAAKQTLAEQAAPDAETVAAYHRLGIQDYLLPEHVTTNQVFRELAEGAKSIPGSEANAQSKEKLLGIAKRANDLIEQLGGTHDLSELNESTREGLTTAHSEARAVADKLYDQIREAIPAKTPTPADTVIDIIKARADELGGVKNLSSMEKSILGKLAPKTEAVPMPEAPTGRITAAQFKAYTDAKNAASGLTQTAPPTYALVDDVRRNLGLSYKGRGPFATADTNLVDKLYGAITQDQGAVAQASGAGQLWAKAKQATQVYKGIQNDLTSLFGKNVDRSMTTRLGTAMGALTKGNDKYLINFLKSVPQNMRQKVVASGLASAFGKHANNNEMNFGNFARWYEGLKANSQSFNAVMSNLPPQARQQLQDLYRAAKGISLASREHITTGRVAEITKKFADTDNLIGNLYKTAHHVGKGVVMEAATSAIGMHGAGLAAGIASALTAGKTTAIQATDKLIASPAFQAAVKQIASGEQPKQIARHLAISREFTKFAKAVNSRELSSNKEKWVLNALSAGNNNEAGQ